MSYLVDANVLSEPTRPLPNSSAVQWLAAHEQELVVDPIILGEVQIGILALPSGHKRSQLENWFEEVVATIECVAWDREISRRWAQLVADLKQKGRPIPIADSMIAATALTHGFVMATRNTSDFQSTGVEVVNPFD